MSFKSFLLFVIIPLFLISCGKDTEGDAAFNSPSCIYAGEEIKEEVFPEVVQIKVGGGSCTATFIRDDLLLTAAHCLEGYKSHDGEVALKVLVNGKNLISKKVFIHPSYSFDNINSDEKRKVDLGVVF